MQLDPAAARAGTRLEAFDALGSTNEEALVRARRGERGPLWIVARRQTAGRGRRGRTWVSEPGNLYATLLLTEPAPPERAAELSFVAALAVHDALAAVAPGSAARLAVKWPNDLLLDGRKLAGILVEGENAGGAFAVAIGVGVNCSHCPAGTSYPAAALSPAGFPVTPERLLSVLSRTLLERLAQWRRDGGFAMIRADWLARAAAVGRHIRVSLGEEEVGGRFDGIDEAGRMVLTLQDGTARVVTAGDVLAATAGVPTA
jgi:BirA family biotin operon repressor/biotin-[acetyl-CoA-carboxylase] ligase